MELRHPPTPNKKGSGSKNDDEEEFQVLPMLA